MGTQQKASPSLGTVGTTLPSSAISYAPGGGSDTTGARWGIDNTLSGWIIQSEDIASENITDTTQDQKGAVISQLDYDRHWTLSLNLIGGTGGSGDGTEDTALPKVGDIDFSYAGHKWKVNGVTYNGSYESKKSYTVTAERWFQWPPQS